MVATHWQDLFVEVLCLRENPNQRRMRFLAEYTKSRNQRYKSWRMPKSAFGFDSQCINNYCSYHIFLIHYIFIEIQMSNIISKW